MPRAFDPSLPGGGLPITHSPLNRVRYNVIPQDIDFEQLLEEAFEGLTTFIENTLFPAIKDLTGIDLSVFLPLLDLLDLDFSGPVEFLQSLINAIIALPAVILQLVVGIFDQILEMTGIDLSLFLPILNLLTLDFSSPEAFLGSLITAITNVPAVAEQLLVALMDLIVHLPEILSQLANSLISTGVGLLGPDSALNAFNLFGTLPGNVFSSVPIGALTNTLANIIPLGGLFRPGSIASGGGWLVDMLTTVNGSSSGSAKITADGLTHGLLGTLISVVPGQVFNLSAMTKWTGLASTGSPIEFGLVGLLGGVPVLNTVLDAITSPGSASSGWQPLSGVFTVPSSGVDTIRVRLGLTPGATAGDVWFAGITGTQPGEIAQTWVKDLPEQFAGILDILGLGTLADLIGPNVDALWTDLIETILNPLDALEDSFARINIQESIDSIIEAVEGIPIVGGTIAEMFDAVEEIFDTALDGQSLGTDNATTIQDVINWTWRAFTIVEPTVDKLPNEIYFAAVELIAILAQGPAAIANVSTNQAENTQTKQILSGVVITPINTLVSTIKSWYDLYF